MQSCYVLSSVSIPGTGTYRMEYYHIDKGFPGHDLSNVDHWGYYNAGGASPDITLDSLYFTNLDWTAVTGRKPDSSYAIRGMLSKIIYPTGGYTTFVYEPHTYKDIVSRDRTNVALPSLKSERRRSRQAVCELKRSRTMPLRRIRSVRLIAIRHRKAYVPEIYWFSLITISIWKSMKRNGQIVEKYTLLAT